MFAADFDATDMALYFIDFKTENNPSLFLTMQTRLFLTFYIVANFQFIPGRLSRRPITRLQATYTAQGLKITPVPNQDLPSGTSKTVHRAPPPFVQLPVEDSSRNKATASDVPSEGRIGDDQNSIINLNKAILYMNVKYVLHLIPLL